jgi:hypothetical protein
MKKSTQLTLIVVAVSFCTVISVVVWHAIASRNTGRDEMLDTLLHDMPADTSAVLYVDVAQLRQSTFTQKLFAWAPKPQADADYARFIQDTGFDYERDLNRVVFAAAKRGSQSVWFAIADGTFDQRRLVAYIEKIATIQRRGGRDIYSIPAAIPLPASGNTPAPAVASQMSLAFLHSGRIAVTSDADLSAYLDQKNSTLDPGPWRTRFGRLAGSPVFVVARQDPNAVASLAAQAPGGFQSPQLSALLSQLSWLTVAAQPQSDALRIVAEGETATDTVASQLSDMLTGVLILAQAGLNSAKPTQQLDPQARAAYLELLKSADITRLDRGDLKAVRVVFAITPNFLNAATLPKSTQSNPPAPAAAPSPAKPAPAKSAPGKRSPTR